MIIFNSLLIMSLVIFGIFRKEITEKYFSSNPEMYNYIFSFLILLVFVPFLIFSFKDVLKYFLGSPEEKRILATGRSARAKIISLGESKEGIVTINEQPLVTLKLEVYDGNKPPYQVEIERIISRLEVPKLQPGAMLAIKIDPQNPQKVVIDPTGKGLGEGDGTPHFGGESWTEQDRKLLNTEGIDGEAKIISVEDTGESKDFNPVVKINFEVHTKDKSPYKLTKNIPISTEGINLVKTFIGKTVPAKIHPNDSSKVELKFNP